MILDTYTSPQTNYNTDICIVGAGAAGITIAKEFENTNTEVLILETGGEDFEPEFEILNKGEVDYSNQGLGYVLETTRARGLGGTTNLWSGCCAPFTNLDMEKRPWFPFSGWPIARQELDQFYIRSHLLLNIGKYDEDTYNVKKYLKKTGRHNIPFDGTNGIIHKMFRYMAAPLRFKKLAFKLRKHSRIKFLTHAHCNDFHLSKNGKFIQSIGATNFRGWKGKIHAKVFILAAGGIDNAKILLNTEKNGSAALGNNYDQVGRYFMEHPHIPCGWITSTTTKPWIRGKTAYRKHSIPYKFGNQIMDIAHWFVVGPSDEAQRSHGIGNFSASFDMATQGADDWVSKRREKNKFLKNANFKFFNKLDSYPGPNTKDLTIDNNQTAMIYCRMEQSPNPNSRISLSKNKDPLGLRQVKLHWKMTDLDKRTAIISTKLIAKEVARLSYGRCKLEDWQTDERNWNDVRPLWGCHHMGTTRMGMDKKTSVVDASCRVHDIENLFIAGASVFTTTGYVNPTLNLVTLAIRLADHIKKSVFGNKKKFH